MFGSVRALNTGCVCVFVFFPSFSDADLIRRLSGEHTSDITRVVALILLSACLMTHRGW